MSSVSETTLRTLAFAEAFGMPLTGFEVWQWLLYEEPVPEAFSGPSPYGVCAALTRLKTEGRIIEQDGYYTFPDRIRLIENRVAGGAIAAQKLALARRWARRITRLPYVRGVFADGSLATGMMREESDLDVFVITRAGHIFTARFLVTLFTELVGIRRTQTHIRDRVCLNHYATDITLAFPYRSAFTAWLLARLFPLSLTDPALGGLFFKENMWVTDFFPNLRTSPRFHDTAPLRGQKRDFRSVLPGALERMLRSFELSRIRKNPLTHQGGGRVVASDAMMLFHPELPEDEVWSAYRDRCQNLGLASAPLRAIPQ